MSDQTMPADTLPHGGGSYIRLKDGSLKLDEAPTAPVDQAEAPVEPPVEGAVQRPAKSKVKEA